MTKKVASFLGEKNRGDRHRQLPPRVTPTLVTPLNETKAWFRRFLCHPARKRIGLIL